MNQDKSISSLYYGPVILYYSKSLWTSDAEWFHENGFQVVAFDASDWLTKDEMFLDFHNKFFFPSYFGRNLDALIDCLRDLSFEEHSGILVNIENFDVWMQENKQYAHALLDVLALISYEKLVGGDKFVIHAQTNNPNTVVSKVGARRVSWSMAEFSNKSRGV